MHPVELARQMTMLEHEAFLYRFFIFSFSFCFTILNLIVEIQNWMIGVLPIGVAELEALFSDLMMFVFRFVVVV
jgi:hypothetical protein